MCFSVNFFEPEGRLSRNSGTSLDVGIILNKTVVKVNQKEYNQLNAAGLLMSPAAFFLPTI